MPVKRSRSPPRCSGYCAPGRISSGSGLYSMALVTRQYLFAGALLLLGACAHQPAKPPEREPIVVPPTPTPPQPTVAPPDAAGATPSLTMPREWQHHNGDGYAHLFDRMCADLTLDKVQKPAIHHQLARFEHNPDYL